MADVQGNHLRAAEVPRAGRGDAFENPGHIQRHPKLWRMRKERWGWYVFTLRSGISIRTRSECLDFRQAGIWWQR